MKFKVECVFRLTGKPYVLARQLEPGEVYITAASRLSGVPIQSSLSMPIEYKGDGRPDLDVFHFTLAEPKDKERFFVGQIIELET